MLPSLRRANAVSKIVFALSLCAYVFLCPDWRILVGLAGILAGLLVVSGEWDRSVTVLCGVFVLGLPTLLLIFLLGGVEKATNWRDGLWLGFTWLWLFMLRLFVLLFVDLLVVKWTTFSDMLLSLRALRLPGKVVLFVSAMVGLVPRAFETGVRVVEVQECRGLSPRRLLRPRNLLALFVPVFLIQMRRATELALSLELRGILSESGGRRPQLPFGFGDGIFLVAAVVVWLVPLWTLLPR